MIHISYVLYPIHGHVHIYINQIHTQDCQRIFASSKYICIQQYIWFLTCCQIKDCHIYYTLCEMQDKHAGNISYRNIYTRHKTCIIYYTICEMFTTQYVRRKINMRAIYHIEIYSNICHIQQYIAAISNSNIQLLYQI